MHQNTFQKVAVMLLIIGQIIPCHLLGLVILASTLYPQPIYHSFVDNSLVKVSRAMRSIKTSGHISGIY